MVVLVTGAAGFIGAATSQALLERGDRVVGIDNLNDYYDPKLKQARLDNLERRFENAFRFERTDFADVSDLQRVTETTDIDAIVHLGAQAGVRYSLENPTAYVQSNLVGHVNMLELARHRRPRHMVYASSSSVYGSNKSLPFRVEDRAEHPLSLYGATKKADELLSESYGSLYRLPLTGLAFSPSTVRGVARHGDVDFYKRSLRRNAAAIIQRRRNAARLHLHRRYRSRHHRLPHSPPVDDGEMKAGGSTSPHALYNIGNSRSEDLMRVVELLERETGKKALLDPKPMQIGDVQETFADISAIERDHGFSPATTIDKGVPRFVEWYRRYHGI